MPGRNTLKVYLPQSYYHAYNRGWNRGKIFLADEDYEYFELLLSRTLSPRREKDPRGRLYKNFYSQIQLNAYCLMPNHFHLLLYQKEELVVPQFLQSVCTAYAMYFNKKYKRRGPLFENRFKAVPITHNNQLQHISRYIHLNHWNYKTWLHSSYGDYIKPRSTREWVSPQPILDLFDSMEQYQAFCAEYEPTQRMNDVEKRSYTI